MTSNIVLKCSGNANKDAVAAILSALLPAEMRRRICAKCLKGHKKSRAWRGEIKIEGNGRNGIFENPRRALRDDRRIMESADLLDIPPIQMLGHVLSLWLWALHNAPGGYLGNISAKVIAQASRLEETVLRLLDEDVEP